jgi:hypothetical protein
MAFREIDIAGRTSRSNRVNSLWCSLASASLALVLLGAGPAIAGQITGVTWFSGVASVAGTVVNPPSAPNNDDVVGPSPNTIFVLQKDYIAIGPVDLEFTVIDSGGTTEYAVVEGVQNNTGLDWSGYHVELGFGVGAGFVKSTSGDGLDFDAPFFNSTIDFNPAPGFFPTVTPGEDDLIAGGGIMPDFAFAGNFVFHIDVPDGITSFTLRQSPLPVPEPGTFLLTLLGLLGLSWRRRGRRSQLG